MTNWGVYKGLEDSVKNMMTSLLLVSDLAHPSMRDRHWDKLNRTSGKQFTMDENFSLGALLALGLHNFVEEVADIVDSAQKELIIEKQLVNLEKVWEVLKLEFVAHGETEIMLVQLPEELVEGLDDGQVQLQAMAGSKYVASNQQFQDQVNIFNSSTWCIPPCTRTSSGNCTTVPCSCRADPHRLISDGNNSSGGQLLLCVNGHSAVTDCPNNTRRTTSTEAAATAIVS